VSLLLGGSSKVLASTITYPYQLVKSKLQQRDGVNAVTLLQERRYDGTWDCVKKVWRYNIIRYYIICFSHIISVYSSQMLLK
jgi:hypothetical protein